MDILIKHVKLKIARVGEEGRINTEWHAKVVELRQSASLGTGFALLADTFLS